MSDTIKVTFGADVLIIPGTATVPTRMTSATLKVDGKAPSARKGDTVPTLRLTTEQVAALRKAGAAIVKAGTVSLPRSAGRGRPRKAGVTLTDFFGQ